MNDLEVNLEAPDVAADGEPVVYAVVIRNGGDRPLDLHLQGREPTFDLTVSGEAGAILWRRLEGQIVQSILRLDSLGPGESITLEDVWDQRDLSGNRVGPGIYALKASVLTDGDPLPTQERLLRVK